MIQRQTRDIGENHHPGVADGGSTELSDRHRAGLQKIGQPFAGVALAIGLQSDLEKIGFTPERFSARMPIHHQHRHSIPHRQTGPKDVVSLETVRVGGDFHHVRSGLGKSLGEQDLSGFARSQRYLGHIFVFAIHMKRHAQGIVMVFAVVAQIRPHLHGLVHPQQQMGKLE